MKHRWFAPLFLAISATAIVMTGISLTHLRATDLMHPRTATTLQQAVSQASEPLGDYRGTVNLTGAYSGTYVDTTAEILAQDLGYVDLALSLYQDNGAVDGYVILDDTLIFTATDTIIVTPIAEPGSQISMDIGPKVEGTFDGLQMTLTSERFDLTLNPERELDAENGQEIALDSRVITRQFVLRTSEVRNNGEALIGEYRETVWGYGPVPTTIVGQFELQRPAYEFTGMPIVPEVTPAPPTNFVYLPFVDK